MRVEINTLDDLFCDDVEYGDVVPETIGADDETLLVDTEYDSFDDTMLHIERVEELIDEVTVQLDQRSKDHDLSKLSMSEKPIFDKYTRELKELIYGSPEYTEAVRVMRPALCHHYANNRHHPEHFPMGVQGMNLVDLIEMLADWKASTSRGNKGDMMKSLKVNQERFGYSDELNLILVNTVNAMDWK